MKSMNTIAKGAFIVFLGILFGKLFSFGHRVILSRLGEQAYGEFSLTLALLGLLTVISIIGLDTGLTKFISSHIKDNRNEEIKGSIKYSLKISIIIAILLATSLYLFSNFISINIFHNPELSLLIKIIALGIPIECIRSLITAIFKAYQKIEYDVYGRILLENILKIILTIIFIKLGLGIIGATIAYILSIFISMLFLIYLLKTKINIPNLNTFKDYKEIIIYSLPLVFNSLTIMIMTWADTIMLGYFTTEILVGIYNVAVPVAKLILLPATAIISLHLPLITSLKENEEQKKVYYTTTKWIFLSTTLASIWLIIYGKELIQLFFGLSYITAYSSLCILTIGYLINSLIYTSRDFLLLTNKTKLILKATLIGCIINIILNLILIPKYSILGAAIATSISFIILSLILLISANKTSQVNPFKKTYLLILITIILSGILTKLITSIITIKNLTFIIIFSIILITTFTLINLYLLKLFETDDKEMITTILNKIK